MNDRKPFYRRRPFIIGASLGLVVAGAGAAFAATAALTTTGIVAGTADASGCDTAFTVAVGSPSWDDTTGSYLVSTVDYSAVDAVACANQTLQVDIVDDSGASIATASTTIDGAGDGTGTLTITPSVNAEDIATTASVIYEP